MSVPKNYYGSLCTEMYEILHETAPEDELEFYLSYAQKGQKILEPLCGSGRFLIPFMARGCDITGMDLYFLRLRGAVHGYGRLQKHPAQYAGACNRRRPVCVRRGHRRLPLPG